MTFRQHLALPAVFAVSLALAAASIAEINTNSATWQNSALAQAVADIPQVAEASSKVAKEACGKAYSCIGMVIDSGDPILTQMGYEMSDMVSDKNAGTVVRPTEGPIANVRRMLSTENAGLSVVPSDMLLYTARSEDPRLKLAESRLRFVMSIGRKVVHVIARKDIARLEDLDGKRVVMGPDNTALWVVSNNLLHLHGATPSKRIQLKPPAGIKAVLSDEADAVFVVGDIPMKPVQKLAEMLESPERAAKADQVHMLEIELPADVTEYQPATLNYPGLAEGTKSVAILPTLVSYDFTHKPSAYFQRRCRELSRIGATVRDRLEELRASGHKQWRATTWELEAGNWKQDDCFFGKAAAQIAGAAATKVRAEVREAQRLLNALGYDVGTEDGILGPATSAGLKKFQEDQKMAPNGELSADLLAALQAQETPSDDTDIGALGSH